MPVAKVVKDLMKKMVTLQSPRTQCCCCAIGVFAAMFGIFMLSAGICIVLNVSYMEVDTSGLPPDLHNEDGKKIVGIILICVAICTLGLSAAVSIVYFAICNRTPRHPAKSSNANGHVIHSSSHHLQNTHHNKHTTSGKGHKTGNGVRSTQPGSASSMSVGASSASLSKPRPGPSGVFAPIPSHGQSPSTGTKRGQGSAGRRKNNMKKVKTHQRGRARNATQHPRLPTHREEDAEAARSVVDLKNHQSGAGGEKSNMATSSTLVGHSTTSFINKPTIVVDEPPTSPSALFQNSKDETLEVSPLSESYGFTVTKSQTGDSSGVSNDRVYTENEISRTTSGNGLDNTISSQSSINSLSNQNQPQQYLKDKFSYTNMAFQGDASIAETTLTLDHDKGVESSTEDNIEDINEIERFTPPPPSPPSSRPHPSFNLHKNPLTSTPAAGRHSAFPQYPESTNNSFTTNPLLGHPTVLDHPHDFSDDDSITSSNPSILYVKPQTPELSDSKMTASIHSSDTEILGSTGQLSTSISPSSRHHDRYVSKQAKASTTTATTEAATAAGKGLTGGGAAKEMGSEAMSRSNVSLNEEEKEDIKKIKELLVYSL